MLSKNNLHLLPVSTLLLDPCALVCNVVVSLSVCLSVQRRRVNEHGRLASRPSTFPPHAPPGLVMTDDLDLLVVAIQEGRRPPRSVCSFPAHQGTSPPYLVSCKYFFLFTAS